MGNLAAGLDYAPRLLLHGGLGEGRVSFQVRRHGWRRRYGQHQSELFSYGLGGPGGTLRGHGPDTAMNPLQYFSAMFREILADGDQVYVDVFDTFAEREDKHSAERRYLHHGSAQAFDVSTQFGTLFIIHVSEVLEMPPWSQDEPHFQLAEDLVVTDPVLILKNRATWRRFVAGSDFASQTGMPIAHRSSALTMA